MHTWLADLSPQATVGDLPAHDVAFSLITLSERVALEFERCPDLPGVILRTGGSDSGYLVSRGLFFQRLSRPFRREIYLKRPLSTFLDEPLPDALTLSCDCRIADASVAALDRPAELTYEPLLVRASDGSLRVLDVYVLLRAQSHLLAMAQAAMLQSEKLASLGQLAAGVAHEINNPLAFVTNNLAIIQRDAKILNHVLSLYARADSAIASTDAALSEELSAYCERVDLQYTSANLPDLAGRAREGLRRIQEIVKDLRNFARLDLGEESEVDINAAIRSTANIIQGRGKSAGVEIELQLGELPMAPGSPGKINQVIMNLLANAIDASRAGDTVIARSMPQGDSAVIEVIDTGAGIEPTIAGRIFDPFFTTKPPGQGTGLGLTISYGIIRDHGGEIDFATIPGNGTTFRVKLPLRRKLVAAERPGLQELSSTSGA